MSSYTIPLLPLTQDVETKAVLKKVALARTALAELNGVAESIPNEVIILNGCIKVFRLAHNKPPQLYVILREQFF